MPIENYSYHPKLNFYDSVAKYVNENKGIVDVVNLYMTSGSNAVIHKNEELSVSYTHLTLPTSDLV